VPVELRAAAKNVAAALPFSFSYAVALNRFPLSSPVLVHRNGYAAGCMQMRSAPQQLRRPMVS